MATAVETMEGAGRMARALGWFSLALGAAEVLAPRRVDRASGLRPHPLLTRSYGLREIAAGVGLLTAADPTPFAYARVAGDVVDIASLLPAAARFRLKAWRALAIVLAVTAADCACVSSLSEANGED